MMDKYKDKDSFSEEKVTLDGNAYCVKKSVWTAKDATFEGIMRKTQS